MLKIREKDKNLYKDVLSGETSIKNAYLKVFPSKKEKQPVQSEPVVSTYVYPKEEEPDFAKILSMLKDLNVQLTEHRGKLSEDPSLKELKEIDTEIFNLRKNVG